MTDREAMKLALEALEKVTKHFTRTPSTLMDSEARVEAHSAITALRQALEQPEDEPFGYFQYSMHMDAWVQNRDNNKGAAFYTRPQPAAQWVGLTDEEVAYIADSEWEEAFVRLVEAKLKEKNGG